MKKALSLILALVLCLSLCACGDSSKNKLSNIICGNTWISSDHIYYIDTIDRKIIYTTLFFFEDGTCKYIYEDYTEGKLTSTSNTVKNWKIEKGEIAVFPDIVDSETDTIYYEYSDGQLIGSAWYCDRFTYILCAPTNTEPSQNEEPTETTQAPITYYDGTLFPTIEAYVDCPPTLTKEELWTIYNYTDITNNQKEYDEYMHFSGKFMIAFDDYEREILGNFTKKYHYEDQENSGGDTATIWYDGNGFALTRRIFFKDKKECRLAIYIMEESNVPTYLEHYFND